MLALPIVMTSLEYVIALIVNAFTHSGGVLSLAASWFVVIAFAVATIGLVISLCINAVRVRKNIFKGQSIAGMVISIIGASTGVVFFVTCIAATIALLH